ncbi:MAG: 7-carboxy-7-deazaguanine synthase QueE [Cyanobacteria bacterium P01_C01_bin.89]
MDTPSSSSATLVDPAASAASTSATASLVEIFSAIQGEGMNIGTRQLFIRFGRCDLRCNFCDSANTWTGQPTCDIEQTAGLRDFVTQPNPVSLEDLVGWVQRLDGDRVHDSISLTGGEPLLHAKFLQRFLPVLREELPLLPIYLETGGHRPDLVESILPLLDSIGMDMKLPSVSGENRWDAHGEFLRLCVDKNVDIFVKAIVSDTTTLDDLDRTGELINAADPNIPLILQPVTPLPKLIKPDYPVPQAPAPEDVLAWQTRLKKVLPQVRVIPQSHKMIGQM